jgi:PAS domain S-box-containing protein
MKKISTRNIIVSFFLITLVCVIYFVMVTYRNMRDTKLHSYEVRTSVGFLEATEVLLANLQELENTQRGYVFSSRENFSLPYFKAINNLSLDTARLNVMGAEHPATKQQADEIKQLLVKMVENSQQTIALFDSAGIYPVVDLINKGSSKQLSDSIKQKIGRLENANREVVSRANRYLTHVAQATTYRFFILAFVFLTILVLFFILISDDLKKINQSARQLSMQASLIDTIPDAIFTTNEHYIIKSWNRHAAELYGFTAAHAIGKPINEIFKTHISPEEYRSSLEELNQKGSYKDEYLVSKKNGQQIYVLSSINTILDDQYVITGYMCVHRDITKRKQLEKELKVFNTQLEQQVSSKTAETFNILERITDGFLALDENFTFTYVNKKAGEILGHIPADMIGKNIFTGFKDKTSNQFNNACLASFNTQQYRFVENFYAPLQIWLENDIYPSSNGLSVFFKDSTYKKNAELALKESEEHYKLLVENLHAGVVVYGPDGRVLLCNQKASRLLDVPADVMQQSTVQQHNWNFISAEGRKLQKEDYPVMRVLASKEPLYNVILGAGNNPKEKNWLLINAFPEFTAAGSLKQIVVTFVDITDRKKTEEELKRSEQMLNLAQSIAKTGSWEFNLLTQDLKWSKELYRIFEIDASIVGNDLYQLYQQKFHPDDLQKLEKVIQYAITTKKGYKYQHRIICKDAVIKHILGIGEVILNEEGAVTGLKGTGQDITELVQAEEKLQQSYQQIKQLVTHLQDIREQERTNIAREIHDELGQQLTGLKMYVSWLSKKNLQQEPEIKEKFSAAMELIEETIKSVRKISMELRPSLLDDLGLLAAIEWQSTEFEKRSGIATEFINLTSNQEVPSRIKTGLFRIFQESLTNVARHADAKKIVSSLKFDDNKFTLTITDDGKGFLLKNIESKKTLGLFGMQERTREMGGRYEIKSEPGLGTTVSVTVPV